MSGLRHLEFDFLCILAQRSRMLVFHKATPTIQAKNSGTDDFEGLGINIVSLHIVLRSLSLRGINLANIFSLLVCGINRWGSERGPEMFCYSRIVFRSCCLAVVNFEIPSLASDSSVNASFRGYRQSRQGINSSTRLPLYQEDSFFGRGMWMIWLSVLIICPYIYESLLINSVSKFSSIFCICLLPPLGGRQCEALRQGSKTASLRGGRRILVLMVLLLLLLLFLMLLTLLLLVLFVQDVGSPGQTSQAEVDTIRVSLYRLVKSVCTNPCKCLHISATTPLPS